VKAKLAFGKRKKGVSDLAIRPPGRGDESERSLDVKGQTEKEAQIGQCPQHKVYDEQRPHEARETIELQGGGKQKKKGKIPRPPEGKQWETRRSRNCGLEHDASERNSVGNPRQEGGSPWVSMPKGQGRNNLPNAKVKIYGWSGAGKKNIRRAHPEEKHLAKT